MFGANRQRGISHSDGSSLDVHSVFYTIQGEGPFSGTPAVFVRLAFCNLACSFCDTEFEKGSRQVEVSALLGEVLKLIEHREHRQQRALVVITGGEPLRQNIVPFVKLLQQNRCSVQIETAGTVWPEGLEQLIDDTCSIVCSPKTAYVHRMVINCCHHWKYIVSHRDTDPEGIPQCSMAGQDANRRVYKSARARDTIWVQPLAAYREHQAVIGMVPDIEETGRNALHAVQLSMKFGYKLSLQIHKILELP